MSWDFPLNNGLRDRIDKLGLHPITAIVSLLKKEKQKLLDMGVVLCKGLNTDILKSLGIDESRIPDIMKESTNLCRKNK